MAQEQQPSTEDNNNNNSTQEQSPNEPQQQQREAEVWNKDVGETGRWGSLNKKELMAVLLISVLLIVVTIVGVVVGTKDARADSPDLNNGGKSKIDPVTGKRVSAYVLPQPPTFAVVSDQMELDTIRTALTQPTSTTVMSSYTSQIPTTVSELSAAMASDTTLDPVLRAAAWITTVDTMNFVEVAAMRFALAAMYYTTNGSQWNNSTNWLSSTHHHCEWYGVTCCPAVPASVLCTNTDFYKVVEIDFYKNNLQGPIPVTFSMVSDLQAVFLNDNQLSGPMNGDIFASLPNFSKLYAQYNQFTGTIPVNLDTNEKFDTLYVQGNQLTGSFPETYCALGVNGLGKIVNFGMDCAEVPCDAVCCQEWENCFYPLNETETASA